MRGWDERGWEIVPSVLSADELVVLREECERLSVLQLDDDGLRRRVAGSPERQDRLDPIIDLSPAFAALADDARVRRLAASVLDSDVELMKDKLILKPPGTQGYGLHQDHAYLPVGGPRADEICVVALALANVPIEAGPIEVVPARHEVLLTPDGELVDLEECALGGAAPVPIVLAAGDALLLHHLAPHRSGRNQSPVGRPIVFFTYAARSDRPWREWYYEAATRQRTSASS